MKMIKEFHIRKPEVSSPWSKRNPTIEPEPWTISFQILSQPTNQTTYSLFRRKRESNRRLGKLHSEVELFPRYYKGDEIEDVKWRGL